MHVRLICKLLVPKSRAELLSKGKTDFHHPPKTRENSPIRDSRKYHREPKKSKRQLQKQTPNTKKITVMILRSRTEPISPPVNHNHESTSPSPPASPSPERSDTNSEKQQQQDPPRRKKRSTWLIFTIGGLAGLFLAGFTAKNQDMLRLELLQDLNLDTIIDIIPAGILKEASDITMREKEAVNYDAFSTGLALKAEGLEVVHPVVMVPGVISTGYVVIDLHRGVMCTKEILGWSLGELKKRVDRIFARCFLNDALCFGVRS